MLFNILVGFMIPWIFGIYLYFKDRKTLITIAPIGAAIALLYNCLGFYFSFWTVYNFSYGRMSAIPFDLGLYPILTSYLVYFIKRYKFKSYNMILLFTIFTTIAEFLLVLLDKVIYYNNWNIGWTFISYLIPYITCYLYYLILKKNDLV